MCKLDGLALAAFLHPQAACLRPLGNNQKAEGIGLLSLDSMMH